MLNAPAMNRWSWFWICLLVGLGMLVCGLRMPAHLRALDASVLEQCGRNTPSLTAQVVALVGEKTLGAALMLWQAAQLEAVPNRETFGEAVNDLARENPGL